MKGAIFHSYLFLIISARLNGERYAESSYSLCPNFCSGHGICHNVDRTITCDCFVGYHGGDCSYRICPSGRAWFDNPSGNNVAHGEFAECSNMGTCNRETGICNCRSGFTGAACDSLICPMGTSASGLNDVCSGHGRCISLRDAAGFPDYLNYLDQVIYDDWDADMVHGCSCDEGWEGSSCSRRSCPKGDDPYTSGQSREIQILECVCSGDCTGSFRLTFQGQTSAIIPLNASISMLKYRLEQLSNIELVNIEISGTDKVCNGVGVATKVYVNPSRPALSYVHLFAVGGHLQITFLLPQGNVAALEYSDVTGTVTLSIIAVSGAFSALDGSFQAMDGETEYLECSGRGVCDYSTGVCDCFDGFLSSNGLGGAGSRGDCGHFHWNMGTHPVDLFCPIFVNSDTNASELCSGHGVCTAGSCICTSGYGGPGCSEHLCSSTNAWFGSVGQSHEGLIECAGVGDCDRRSGICRNCGGSWGTFYGDSCEFLSCVSDAMGNVCGGNGACLSLRQVAELTYAPDGSLANFVYTTPWDADMVRGCSCFREVSIDNQYSDALRPVGHKARSRFPDTYNISLFHRGPYADGATSWLGYNCDEAFCPKGIDPQSRNAIEGQLEIQQIHCRGATNGTFRLSFRGNLSRPIPYDANAADLKSFIEEMYTINRVSVTLNDTSICNVNKVPAYVTFLTEFGDLPLLVPTSVSLQVLPDPTPHVFMHIIRVTREQKGTFEEYECSRQGICDRSSGKCHCFPGFASSDGLIGTRGERGDCTYVDKYNLKV